MPTLSARDFFLKVDGREFRTDGELNDEILKLFNEHLSSFPPRYSYLQLIEWGKKKQWIQRHDRGFKVSVAD